MSKHGQFRKIKEKGYLINDNIEKKYLNRL